MNARGLHVYAALEESFGLDEIREALPTGTPVRRATRSTRSALTHVPFWLFRSTSTYPAASGRSSA